MSRCFPYPPPGYAPSSERNEALIESIKLQKEKQRKKEKRREKKEKRKERKERRKEKTTQNLDNSDIMKDHVGQKIYSDPKIKFFQKGRATESEQFEQSSLTEEHGLPNALPVPSSSYESTETSNKRKRHSSPISDSHNHGHGKPILIRLPSKMQIDFHTLSDGQQLCSVSGRTDFPSQHKDDTGFNGRPENFGCTSEGAYNVGRGFAPRSKFEETCSTSRQIELQYEDLLENCFPPRLEDASLYPADSDWLFQDRKRNRDIQHEKRQRCGSESISCSRNSSLRPHAEYMLEVDVYALPFVVPY